MSGSCVTELSLRHFRSHRRVDLSFDGRPVAIHGPNGAGKTNLIEAVSLLSPGRGLRRAGPDDLIRRPEALGWKVRATVAGHEIELGAEPGTSRAVRIDGKAAPQVALARVARVLWLVPSMDRLWIEGADGRRRFLDRAVLSLDPGHAEAVLDYEKAMRERNRLLKDMVRDAHWYDALEGRMAQAGMRVQVGRAAAARAWVRWRGARGGGAPRRGGGALGTTRGRKTSGRRRSPGRRPRATRARSHSTRTCRSQGSSARSRSSLAASAWTLC